MAKRPPNLTRRNMATLLAGMNDRIEARGSQEVQWIRHFAHAVEEICTIAEPAWPYWSMFWTMLYGILVEVSGRYRLMLDPKLTSGAVGVVVLLRRVPMAIDALRAKLTRDELIMLDYLRHNHAHVYQHAFYAQISDGKLKDEVPIRTLGERLKHAGVHAAVSRQLKSAGGNERLLARDWAQRLRPLLPALQAALVATKGMKNPPEQDRAFSEMLEQVRAKAIPDSS